MSDATTAQVLLWVVVPYVTFAVFVVGSLWRYRYDKFGWTTRSSELYENRLLRLGSPLFHFGLLAVILGHFVGLVIPKSWTEAVGVNETIYHALATYLGSVGALALVVGLVILIYRRRTTGPVFLATTTMDKTMYVFLAASALLGAWATVATQLFETHGYDYRETISPWFRSLWYLQPDPSLMTGVPAAFQLHIVAALALFCLWPFTRLVHAFSAPVPYLFRPYIVYRSRDTSVANRAPRRGWDPSERPGVTSRR
jgi:nitrate reductase gamma subunit